MYDESPYQNGPKRPEHDRNAETSKSIRSAPSEGEAVHTSQVLPASGNELRKPGILQQRMFFGGRDPNRRRCFLLLVFRSTEAELVALPPRHGEDDPPLHHHCPPPLSASQELAPAAPSVGLRPPAERTHSKHVRCRCQRVDQSNSVDEEQAATLVSGSFAPALLTTQRTATQAQDTNCSRNKVPVAGPQGSFLAYQEGGKTWYGVPLGDVSSPKGRETFPIQK